MLVRYNKLDRSNKREYSKKLRALCLEFQVQKQYPRNLQERVDKEAALPSRTGLRTKPYAIDAAGAERIACTLKYAEGERLRPDVRAAGGGYRLRTEHFVPLLQEDAGLEGGEQVD